MIYCVEDDQNIRDLIVYTLTSAGYKAKGFPDAEHFYAEALDKKAELILLDIMLPGEDGLSILKRLRHCARFQAVPLRNDL